MASGVALGVVVTLTAMTYALPTLGAAPTTVARPVGEPAAQEHAALAGEEEQTAFLQRYIGDWNAVMKIYFSGPDGPAMEGHGSAVFESVLDGLFVLERSEWTFPNPAGGEEQISIQGIGLAGYDRTRKMFVSTWADSMNTHILKLAGSRSQEGNSITYYGEMDEPMMGVIGRTIKFVHTVRSDDELRLEFIDLHAGDDYKVVEIIYTRRR